MQGGVVPDAETKEEGVGQLKSRPKNQDEKVASDPKGSLAVTGLSTIPRIKGT